MANETHTYVIVPALPGWCVAVLRDDRFAFEPIIAWEIERCEWSDEPSADGRPGEQCVFHSVMPLTVGGNMEQYANMWAIKRPDGKFEVPGEGSFDDEVEAAKYLRKREGLRAAP